MKDRIVQWAIERDHVLIVKLLVRFLGFKINEDEFGWMLARIAAKGQLEMIRFLVNTLGEEICVGHINDALWEAVAGEHIQLVKFLINTLSQKNGAHSIDLRHIFKAAITKNGQLEMVKLLLTFTDTPPLEEIFQDAADCGNIKMLKFFLTLKEKYNSIGFALQTSAKNGDLDMVKFLLNIHAEKDATSIMHLIELAIYRDRREVVEFLIGLPDVEFLMGLPDIDIDSYRARFLGVATINNRMELLKYFFALPGWATPESVDHVLRLAKQSNNFGIVDYALNQVGLGLLPRRKLDKENIK